MGSHAVGGGVIPKPRPAIVEPHMLGGGVKPIPYVEESIFV
jgi:hypothetical protein